jgi:hypothetical protein
VLLAVLAEAGLWTLIAILGTTPADYVLCVLAGAPSGLAFAAVLAVRAEHAPERLRAQVFTSAAGLKVGAAAVGAALSGIMVVAHGPELAIAAAAATFVLAAVAGALSARAAPARLALR